MRIIKESNGRYKLIKKSVILGWFNSQKEAIAFGWNLALAIKAKGW